MVEKTILIVEDSPVIADALKEGLVESGFEVFIAHNGYEALREIEELCPDLIIADINIPKLDGLKVCQAIQNRMPGGPGKGPAGGQALQP